MHTVDKSVGDEAFHIRFVAERFYRGVLLALSLHRAPRRCEQAPQLRGLSGMAVVCYPWRVTECMRGVVLLAFAAGGFLGCSSSDVQSTRASAVDGGIGGAGGAAASGLDASRAGSAASPHRGSADSPRLAYDRRA